MIKKEYLFELIENGYQDKTSYNLAVSRFVKRLKNNGAIDMADIIKKIQMENSKVTRASVTKKDRTFNLFYSNQVNESGKLITDGYMHNIVKSAMFYGKPGTGKTYFVHKMAEKHGMNVVEMNLSSILDFRYGESIKRLEEFFSKNKSKRQIIFFDEADSIFGKRGQKNDVFETSRIITTMLKLLDQQREALVIFATNLIDFLDPAILRRFDIHVNFDDDRNHLEIFKTLLVNKYSVDITDENPLNKFELMFKQSKYNYSISDLDFFAKRIAIYRLTNSSWDTIFKKIKEINKEIIFLNRKRSE